MYPVRGTQVPTKACTVPEGYWLIVFNQLKSFLLFCPYFLNLYGGSSWCKWQMSSSVGLFLIWIPMDIWLYSSSLNWFTCAWWVAWSTICIHWMKSEAWISLLHWLCIPIFISSWVVYFEHRPGECWNLQKVTIHWQESSSNAVWMWTQVTTKYGIAGYHWKSS